jgi:hypothetical protein
MVIAFYSFFHYLEICVACFWLVKCEIEIIVYKLPPYVQIVGTHSLTLV